jgi:hypothetical protein
MAKVVEEILQIFEADKIAFKDWTRAGTLGEYLQKHAYSHMLELRGEPELLKDLASAMSLKYRIYDLVEQKTSADTIRLHFDTSGCIEKEELAHLAGIYHAEVRRNDLWGNI